MPPEQPPETERRAGRPRRTYNRRQAEGAVAPPYFEAFDRIASALESIEQLLRVGHIDLTDEETSGQAPARRRGR